MQMDQGRDNKQTTRQEEESSKDQTGRKQKKRYLLPELQHVNVARAAKSWELEVRFNR